MVGKARVPAADEVFRKDTRFSRCRDARPRKVSRSVATRLMMVVCMPTTGAGGGRECYDFRGRWGFDEAQGALVCRLNADGPSRVARRRILAY